MSARQVQGVVVSDKGNKTIVVLIERRYRHPLLKKIVRRSKKYHAHDEDNIAKIGDVVKIEECVPKSRKKTWNMISKIS